MYALQAKRKPSRLGGRVAHGQAIGLNPKIQLRLGKGTWIMIELSIKIKDEKRSMTEKDFVHDEYLICKSNPDLVERVDAVFKKFSSQEDTEAPTITIRTKMTWQS